MPILLVTRDHADVVGRNAECLKIPGRVLGFRQGSKHPGHCFCKRFHLSRSVSQHAVLQTAFRPQICSEDIRKCMGHATQKASFLTLVLSSLLPAATLPTQLGANTIVQRSIEALKSDWQAERKYDNLERDTKNHESRTYRVMMILGSPYKRMEAVNGMPLSPEDQQQEQRKLTAAIAARCGESKVQTERRIETYNKGRDRDHFLMQEMTRAFAFTMLETTLNGHDAWHLRASPKPGYQPPDREAKVLTGMKGELWIDKSTFNGFRSWRRSLTRSRLKVFSQEWTRAQDSSSCGLRWPAARGFPLSFHMRPGSGFSRLSDTMPATMRLIPIIKRRIPSASRLAPGVCPAKTCATKKRGISG